MEKFFAAVLVLATLGSGAHAQDTAAPKKAKKVLDPNRRVCRSMEMTGSISRTSICHTAAEWAQIDAQERDGGPTLMDQRSGPGSGLPR